MSESKKPIKPVGKQNKLTTDKPIRTVGKRGKDKTPRKKRTDHLPMTSDGDNARMMSYHMQLLSLGNLHDKNDPQEVQQRILDYFTICGQCDFKPAVASLALALGIDRMTLFTWVNGTGGVKSPEVIDTIKKAYAVINAGYEEMMNNGKINPVAGIFLMKNNMGYKDQTDHVVTARQETQETEDSLLDRAGLLTD